MYVCPYVFISKKGGPELSQLQVYAYYTDTSLDLLGWTLALGASNY